MGSFYPHGKPACYAYTNNFLVVGHDVAGVSYANTLYPGLYGSRRMSVTNKALANLQTIINMARAAELAFLKDTGINLENPNASNIFHKINEILNSRYTFERGLQYMKNIANSDKDTAKQIYKDASQYFGECLKKALKIHLKKYLKKDIVKMNSGQIATLINNIIGEALQMTYKQVQDYINQDTNSSKKAGNNNFKTAENKKEKQIINDMIQIIQKLQESGAFQNYGYLFNLNIETLKQMTDRKDRRYKIKLDKKKYSNARVNANFSGNALELITSIIAAEIGNINIANSGLTIKGVHTGQMNQMKADTMLFVAKGEINLGDYLKYVDSNFDSVRIQNIDAMNKYLKSLENNLKHVIMINDKNYTIKANFGGVNTQEKMNLENAGMMLSQFGVGQVTELINYLANCGPGMVQGSVNGEIRTELQTLIGYFLFDHLQIKIGKSKSGPNVVNLLNVSGMYIPLSTYLEGVYKSIQNAMSNPSSFVSVTISLGGETEQSEWTAATWEEFRRSHETESFISYRILKDIASFISSL